MASAQGEVGSKRAVAGHYLQGVNGVWCEKVLVYLPVSFFHHRLIARPGNTPKTNGTPLDLHSAGEIAVCFKWQVKYVVGYFCGQIAVAARALTKEGGTEKKYK